MPAAALPLLYPVRERIRWVAGVTFLAALLAAPHQLCAARLMLGTVTAAPGGSVQVAVTLDPQGGRIGGLQFDIEFDAAALEAVPLLGDALRQPAKSLFLASTATNRQRFVIAGWNQNEIPAGAVLNLLFRVRGGARPGSYPLFFYGLIATDPFGRPAPVLATDGSLTVAGAPGSGPRLSPQGVLSAASLQAGPVSPGGIVSLFGTAIGPAAAQTPATPPTSTELGGFSVWMDGIAAPLLYAGAGQINAIVPFGLANRPRITLELRQGASRLAQFELDMAVARPAIFTQDGSGAGPGAILNQDGSLNTWARPADRGSIAVLFGTGFGVTTPPLADGQVVTGTLPPLQLPVTVAVGGAPAEVLYAGPAPQLVAGAVQVNFRIPAGAPSGAAVPVTVSAGGNNSPAGVTLAIR